MGRGYEPCAHPRDTQWHSLAHREVRRPRGEQARGTEDPGAHVRVRFHRAHTHGTHKAHQDTHSGNTEPTPSATFPQHSRHTEHPHHPDHTQAKRTPQTPSSQDTHTIHTTLAQCTHNVHACHTPLHATHVLNMSTPHAQHPVTHTHTTRAIPQYSSWCTEH